MFSLALLTGCETAPRTYAIPTHIDFDVAAATWTVVTSGEGNAEQLPERVPVFSLWQGERREGVWVVPGTKGAEKILVAAKRGFKIGPKDLRQYLEVPNYIEPGFRAWRIVKSDKSVGVYERDWPTTPPAQADRAGPQTPRRVQSGIRH